MSRRLVAVVLLLAAGAAMLWYATRHTPTPAPLATDQLLARAARQQAAHRPYRAVQNYLRVVQRAPEQAEAWQGLAMLAQSAGQSANARHAAERVLAARPGDAPALAVLAAVAVATPVPSVRPGRPHAATRRRCAAAKRLYDRGRVEAAIIALRAAAWLDDRAARPYRDLANVYYLQQRLSDAVAAQREAVARAPQSPALRRNLAALEAALATPTAAPP
jgi:tetratricopeptide (TPR) repeat protein